MPSKSSEKIETKIEPEEKMSKLTALYDYATAMAEKIILGYELPMAKTIFESETLNVGNIAISADGRIFASMNPLTEPNTKLVEILNRNEATPFPDAQYAEGEFSIIRGTLGINVDKHHRLWILDMEAREMLVWDLASNTMQEHFAIDADTLRSNSFLQDFAIDEKRQRIFIADMTLANEREKASPAIIVIDMATREMKRCLENHRSLKADFDGGYDLNPIAVDPNYEWLYYGAMHSHMLYRIPLQAFDSPHNDYLIESIETFSPKCYCDGIVADNKDQVYVTNIEDKMLGVCRDDSYQNIALLPTGQSWPDGLAIYDGHLYATLSQLDRTAAMNDGKDYTIRPYVIVRTPLI